MAWLVVAIVVGLAGWVGAGLWIKRGVEEPPFAVLLREGDIEVRRYEPTLVAATVVEGEREPALSEAFRRLAGYIFGKNRSQTEISMTAPVSASSSEKIAMTAPVSATVMHEGSFRVTFTMPSGFTQQTLPVPDDERVSIEAVGAREVATIRFSGSAKNAAIDSHTEQLVAWIKTQGRTMVGAPTLAQYDPPFTMPLLRRNEIQVELAPDI